jgi:hypothetical protein
VEIEAEPRRTFDIGAFRVSVATDVGPRILSVWRDGGPKLFAELGDLTIAGGGHTYRLVGGHRLWRAPEAPILTYLPDGTAVDIVETAQGVSVHGEPEPDGIVKSIDVSAIGEFLAVEHTITNHGAESATLAPWAITQFRIGGVAFVPLAPDPGGEDSLRPNRAIVVWPYTDLSIPEFSFGADMIRLQGSARRGKSKIGVANARGWLAYHLDGELFVKWAPVHNVAERHVDLNADMQCFRNESFVELESLGPVVDLSPGESVTHRELWSLTPVDSTDLDGVVSMIPLFPDSVDA